MKVLKIKSSSGEKAEIIKSINQWISNQTKDETYFTLFTQDFSLYDKIYDWSYIVASVVDKITFALNCGRDVQDEGLKNALERIDITFIAKSLVKYGNAFIEIARDRTGAIKGIFNVAAKTIQQIRGGGYLQQSGTLRSYFNSFTPFEERKKQVEVYKKSWAGVDELRYNSEAKSCGFNPKLTEILHIKLTETDDTKRGKSLFYPVLMQILLLKQIDEYYAKYFDGGLIQQKILNDKSERSEPEDLEALKEWFESEAKGVQNAHSTIVYPGELTTTNLSDEINTEAFLNYRVHLQKSIAMRFQIPYDLLDTTDSNKASATTALTAFNRNTVIPIQNLILSSIKLLFGDDQKWRSKKEDIAFNAVDTKDWATDANTIKQMVATGCFTINEIRKFMKYDTIEGGEQLATGTGGANFTLWKDDIEQIKNISNLIKQDHEAQQPA